MLTAHTLDDQAETLLLRALRGTHLAGLTGIAPRSDSRHLLRPLLAARRAELREYLRRRSLAWREDATNADPRVPRNLLRAEVLPLLERVHPGALPHLAALASAARDWREPLEREAEARLAAASREEDGGVWVDLEPLAAHPAAERRLVLVALLRRAGLGARVTRAHVERLERFLETAHPGQALSLPLRRTLLRSTQRVWLGPAAGPGGSFVRELAAGSVLELPRCDLRLCFEPAEAQRPRREGELRLDPPVPGRLIVRSPTPSDVLEAAGGARRLSEWLSDARWPRAIQRRLAVVEKEGRIVGVVGASASGTCTWPPVSAEQCGSDVQWSSDVQCGLQVRAERLSGVSAS